MPKLRNLTFTDTGAERFSIQRSSRILIVQRSANVGMGKWHPLGPELDTHTHTQGYRYSLRTRRLRSSFPTPQLRYLGRKSYLTQV